MRIPSDDRLFNQLHKANFHLAARPLNLHVDTSSNSAKLYYTYSRDDSRSFDARIFFLLLLEDRIFLM
jgi:hypothetical protein